MSYDRARMKLDVKQAIRETRPRPMWITLLYMVILGVGSALIDGLISLFGRENVSGLASLLDQETLSDMARDIIYYNRDMEEVLENLLMSIDGGAVPQLMLVGFIAALLSAVWSGIMNAGYDGYCLAVERRQNPGLEGLFRLFGSFSALKTVVLARLLVSVLMVLWGLPLGIGMGVGFVAGAALSLVSEWLAAALMLAVLAAFVAGMVWVSLRYSFVNFIILDNPNATARQAVGESKELLRGRVGKLFVLHLSFLGWYLAVLVPLWVVAVAGAAAMGVQLVSGQSSILLMGLISIGMMGLMYLVVLVASLFLTPYVTGSTARFYDLARGYDPSRLPLVEEEPNVYTSGEDAPAIPGYGQPGDAPAGEAAPEDGSPKDPADPNAPDRPRYE